jgi:hypothetical protein
MKEQIKNLISALASGDESAAQECFTSVMDSKRDEAVDLKHIAIARKVYGESADIAVLNKLEEYA